MTTKDFTISLKVDLLTKTREDTMIVIARRLAQELLANASMIVSGEKVAKPVVMLTVNSFYDNELKISIMPTEEELAAADENPYDM